MIKWSGRSTKIKNGESIEGKLYQYEVIKEISDGSSIVYQAKRNDGVDVFLKQIRSKKEIDSRVFKKLQELSNIVEKNYEYFVYRDVYFIANEFLKGKSLNYYIWQEKQKLDMKHRFYLSVMVLGVLKVMHSKGIIHSDLKPEQIFVTKDDTLVYLYKVRLIDFDHCIIPALDIYNPAETLGWQSPEHIRKEKIDFYSDVFTMGEIIYTILAKKEPYKDAIEKSTYTEDILNKKGYTSLYELYKPYNVGFPKDISDIIDDMLEPDPKKRPTIKEVHKKFIKILGL